MTPTTGLWSLVEMGNVLEKDKRQQIVALGRLQWPLRRIEEATGVRRETSRAYLKAAGIAVRGRSRPGERAARAAISPPAVSTDPPSPAAVEAPPERAPSASACEPTVRDRTALVLEPMHDQTWLYLTGIGGNANSAVGRRLR